MGMSSIEELNRTNRISRIVYEIWGDQDVSEQFRAVREAFVAEMLNADANATTDQVRDAFGLMLHKAASEVNQDRSGGVEPMGDYVLLEVSTVEKIGSIHIPDSAKSEFTWGTLIRKSTSAKNPIMALYREGDVIGFYKRQATEIPTKGGDIKTYLMNVDSIMCRQDSEG
jgi:hypothetical protein